MSLLNALSRLTLQPSALLRQSNALLHSSPVLCAEPLKKKKKIDPQIIKQREDRRRKKLEKQIRRLEKNARQLKPIEELEVPLDLIDTLKQRSRQLAPLTETELEYRVQLNNKWASYKHKDKLQDFQNIDRVMQSHRKALQELRIESEELYQEAIQPDVALLPVTFKGPVATPPIKDYVSPDGEYILENKTVTK